MAFRLTENRKKLVIYAALAAFVAAGVVTFWFAMSTPTERPQTPTGALLGVDPDHYAYAEQAFTAYPQAFSIGEDQENARKNARLWLISRSVDVPGKPAGEDFWTGPQETGDCVAFGGSHAMNHCLLNQIATGRSNGGGLIFPSYYYGIARRDGDQHNYGPIPCRSAGAIPSLLALNVAKHGPVFFHDVAADGIKYSGALSDKWGCSGVPEKWLNLGMTRKNSEAYPIRSLSELRDALCNGYPATYAGPFTPGRKYQQDGRNCMDWNGPLLGYHQMAIIGYDGSLGEGREYFFIQNSHGADDPPRRITQAATKPLGDEPEGGFWVTWQTMQSMLDRKGEIWAFSAVGGFSENEIDWSEWDHFRAAPQPIQEQNNENVDDRRAAVRRYDLAI